MAEDYIWNFIKNFPLRKLFKGVEKEFANFEKHFEDQIRERFRKSIEKKASRKGGGKFGKEFARQNEGDLEAREL